MIASAFFHRFVIGRHIIGENASARCPSFAGVATDTGMDVTFSDFDDLDVMVPVFRAFFHPIQ
jgi:hypothetical protein